MPERYPLVTALQDTDYIKVVINPETRDSQDAKITVANFFSEILPSRTISATAITMIESGSLAFLTPGGTVTFQGDGQIIATNELRLTFANGDMNLLNDAAGVLSLTGGALNVEEHLKVNGTQVVGARGAAVADATDAPTVITQLNALLARCRAHGLIATS